MFISREREDTSIRTRPIVIPKGDRERSWQAAARCKTNRRGLSLVVVMVAISMSLVLTYSFVRSQTTVMQISQNASRRDLALQAAQTGAAVALSQLQSVDWKGVGTELNGVIQSDGSSRTSYLVSFHEYFSSDPHETAQQTALSVMIQSTGVWQVDGDTGERVERYVEVVARLQPRIPGRNINPGDSAIAIDVKPNPGDFNEIRKYALFEKDHSKAFVIDPGEQIDGRVWLSHGIKLFRRHKMPKYLREALLESIGEETAAVVSSVSSGSLEGDDDGKDRDDKNTKDDKEDDKDKKKDKEDDKDKGKGKDRDDNDRDEGEEKDDNTAKRWHPLADEITFESTPSKRDQEDLERLKTRWSRTSRQLKVPSIQFDNWQRYRLYEGGFEYEADPVDYQLDNVTLRPSEKNPLGIYYCDGDLQIGSNVIVQGTLIVSKKLTFRGVDSHVASFNWRGANGVSLLSGVEGSPRLPAIVAKDVECEPFVRVVIEGAVILGRGLSDFGGRLTFLDARDIAIRGTATSRLLEQPWSTVQLQNQPDLSEITGNGHYSIWLENGKSGAWHTIVGVDADNHQLKVMGESQNRSPVQYRIRRTRGRYVDIRGPLVGRKDEYATSKRWKVAAAHWDELWEAWLKDSHDDDEDDHEDGKKSPPGLLKKVKRKTFVRWMRESKNFSGWTYPFSAEGLKLEPTFHLQNFGTVNHFWAPPLFEPFAPTWSHRELAGYRWKVLSWREVAHPTSAPTFDAFSNLAPGVSDTLIPSTYP